MWSKIKAFFAKEWKKVALITVLSVLTAILFFAAVDIESVLHLIGFIATVILTIFTFTKLFKKD
jgi:multisubunit Na+/H+ antiporter MnhF subunit